MVTPSIFCSKHNDRSNCMFWQTEWHICSMLCAFVKCLTGLPICFDKCTYTLANVYKSICTMHIKVFGCRSLTLLLSHSLGFLKYSMKLKKNFFRSNCVFFAHFFLLKTHTAQLFQPKNVNYRLYTISTLLCNEHFLRNHKLIKQFVYTECYRLHSHYLHHVFLRPSGAEHCMDTPLSETPPYPTFDFSEVKRSKKSAWDGLFVSLDNFHIFQGNSKNIFPLERYCDSLSRTFLSKIWRRVQKHFAPLDLQNTW